jgi:hypothetical protein
VPAVSTYSPTGNILIDGILMGTKWAITSLTYSFPTSASYYGSNYGDAEPSHGFKALNAAQQLWMKSVFANYSAIANVTFTQVTETSTVHGDLRYAESNVPGTAWGYYPATSALGGDVWLNNSTGWYNSPLKGNYAGLTMLHETGHALGLKHPHETYNSFGTEPAAYDSLEYTVMSYRSYVGAATSGGYTTAADSYPQSLMMLDIAAIQQLYGANFTTNAGNTVYSWDPVTGRESINGVPDTSTLAGNKIFLTIWDGGGSDTYDFHNYATALKVDLEPGAWTTVSTAQLANLGNGHYAAGNIANALQYQGNPASLIENAIGGLGNDTIIGNAADNALTGGAGNDSLNGLGGTNAAIYSGSSVNYTWLQVGTTGVWTVTDNRPNSPDGTDTLTNIQNLTFTDKTVALGTPVYQAPVIVNTAPVAMADAYSVTKNGTLTVAAAIGVLANDTDAEHNTLTATLVSGVSRGTLTFKADGSFVYTPTRNYTGTVSFTYKDSDGSLSSNTVTVTISVGSTSGSGNGRGHGAGEMVANDQMPAPAGLVASGAQSGIHGDWNNPLTAWADRFGGHGPEAKAHLAGGLGDRPGHDADLIGLAGLPDLTHHFHAEFGIG